MSEPSCGRDCGGCSKCDIQRGMSLRERQRQTEARATAHNRDAARNRDKQRRQGR